MTSRRSWTTTSPPPWRRPVRPSSSPNRAGKERPVRGRASSHRGYGLIAAAVERVPGVSIRGVRPAQGELAGRFVEPTLHTLLFGAFAGCALLLTGTVASGVPAWRASTTDPANSLRSE